ncbi:MAG: GyrI-like domain-containing protein [Candidatus Latescibacteria bacterium]|nr:GyrI-like domain-containing protein [Candidatus Latescibacterota bacterium]
MHKFLTIVMIVGLILNCGGPKKEASVKTAEFTAEIKMVEPVSVASLERMGPYQEFGKTMSELFNCTMERQIVPTGAPFGIYYDDPSQTKPESTRYEVCLPVSPEIRGDKLVSVKTLPGSEVAWTIHTGAYDNISSTYEKLTKWVDEQGYLVNGPVREIYLNDPGTVPKESLKTEIQFPVIKKTE